MIIPFTFPEDVLKGLATGIYYRIGPTIRHKATGRIVRLLQETGLLGKLTGAINPLNVVLSAGNLASSIGANIQLHKVTVQLSQITSMLSGLQMLNVVNLAASVAGIGVSVAGFAMIAQRLDRVEEALHGMRQDMVASRLAAERVDVRSATHSKATTEALFKMGEQAWLRSDAEQVWRQLDLPLETEHRYWRGLVGRHARFPE